MFHGCFHAFANAWKPLKTAEKTDHFTLSTIRAFHAFYLFYFKEKIWQLFHWKIDLLWKLNIIIFFNRAHQYQDSMSHIPLNQLWWKYIFELFFQLKQPQFLQFFPLIQKKRLIWFIKLSKSLNIMVFFKHFSMTQNSEFWMAKIFFIFPMIFQDSFKYSTKWLQFLLSSSKSCVW